MKHILNIVSALWLLAGCAGLALADAVSTNAVAHLTVPDYYGDIARRVARRLPHEHFLRLPMDDAMSSVAWSNYLASLDYEHLYFTKADIDRFKLQQYTMDDSLEDGDLTGAYDIFETFRARVQNRTRYVEQLLSTNFDLTVKESYHWQRKDAPWPADEAEWNDLWRKKIKNEYLRLYVRRLQGTNSTGTDIDALTSPSVRKSATTYWVNEVTNNEVTNNLTEVATSNETIVAPSLDGVEIEHAKINTAESSSAEWTLRTNFLGFVIKEPITHTSTTTNVLPPPEQVILKGYRAFYDMIVNSDAEWVLQKYLSAFTHAYDPHSDYMSPTDMEEFDIEMKLSLVGIGALLSSEDGTAEIVSLIPGGPAERDTRPTKLQPKDRIVAVAQDGKPAEDILHMPLKQVVRLIRGEKGTRVVLTVVPASDPSGTTTKTVDLIRDQVKLEDQAASWKLHETKGGDGVNRKVAVLKLPAFYASMGEESTDDEGYRSSTYDVAKLLQEIHTNAVDGLILDLRNNGGGALVEAVNMTGLFIPSGPVVQLKEGRYMGRTYNDTDPSVLYDGPMIVLVNRLSASASEILAAALQDYGRAVIVGDSKTHGKGSVQVIEDISRNDRFGKLKITNAAYYRISGRSTQLSGVTSDILLSSPYDMMELGEEFLPCPLKCEPVDPDNYKPLDSLRNVIGILTAKSVARRQAEPEFQAYQRILERVKAVQTNEDLPLELGERRALVSMEENVDKLENSGGDAEKATDDADHGEASTKRDDVVLDETLHIMDDYVTFEEHPSPVAETTSSAASGNADLSERIRNWFKDMSL